MVLDLNFLELMLSSLPVRKILLTDFFSAWDEIHDVFEDAYDSEYDWALVGADEAECVE